MKGSKKLHDALVNLPEGPVPAKALELGVDLCNEMFRIVWEDKAHAAYPPPDTHTSNKEVRAELATAAHNKTVINVAKALAVGLHGRRKNPGGQIEDGKAIIHTCCNRTRYGLLGMDIPSWHATSTRYVL